MIDTIWLKLYTSHVFTNTYPQVKYESAAVNSSQDNEPNTLLTFLQMWPWPFQKRLVYWRTDRQTDGRTDRQTDIPTDISKTICLVFLEFLPLRFNLIPELHLTFCKFYSTNLFHDSKCFQLQTYFHYRPDTFKRLYTLPVQTRMS